MANTQGIIQTHFNNEQTTYAYICDRLLNYQQVNKRYIETYPTDILHEIISALDKKQQIYYWNACFILFKEWGSVETSSEKNAKAFNHLVYLITQLHNNELLPEKEKIKYENILKEIMIDMSGTNGMDSIYADYISLIHLWDMWQLEYWQYLFKRLIKNDINSEHNQSLMLIIAQHVEWDTPSTKLFFNWAVQAKDVPEALIREYFLLRMLVCGIKKQSTITKIKKNQQIFIEGILYSLPILECGIADKNIESWLEVMLDIVQLFSTDSFKCLPDEKIQNLQNTLNRYLSSGLTEHQYAKLAA